MKFIVRRKEWLRGKGQKDSYLLDVNGKRCCIGFVGEQCHIPDHQLVSIRSVERAMHSKPYWCSQFWPMWLQNNDLATDAYVINDDEQISDDQREEQLKQLFEKHGDKIVFVD